MKKLTKTISICLIAMLFFLTGISSQHIDTYAASGDSNTMELVNGVIRWYSKSSNSNPIGWKYNTAAWNITITRQIGNGKLESKTVKVSKNDKGLSTKDTVTDVKRRECSCGDTGEYKGSPCKICGGDGIYYTTKTTTENIIQLSRLEELTGWNLGEVNGAYTYEANAVIEYRYKEPTGEWNYNKWHSHGGKKGCYPANTSTKTATKKMWNDHIGGNADFDSFYDQHVVINAYKVTVNADSGFDLTKTIKLKYTADKDTNYAFNNEKSSFSVWADKGTEAKVIQYTLKKGYNISSGCKTSISKVTGPSVIYLTSTPWTHNVKYNLNGGEGSTPSGFTVTYGVNSVITAKNPARAGYTFVGWKSSNNGKTYYKGNNYGYTCSSNGGSDTLTAQWTPNTYTLEYQPNGGTGTSQKSAATKTGGTVTIINNPFTKDGSTFMGWGLNSGTNKADYKPGDTVAILDLAKAYGVQYESSATIPVYALWDAIPRVEAEDRYFSLEDANTGKITQEELFKNAKAYDVEDGNYTPGANFYLESYTPELYKKMNHNGIITETFVAVDSAGNVTKKMITVHVTDTSPKDSILSEDNQYVRSISLNYLDKAPENGGVMEDSYWRIPDNYVYLKRVLSIKRINPEFRTTSFLGLSLSKEVAGSGTWNDTICQEWVFTKADREKVKDFVSENGMGNMNDKDALKKFLNEFGYCRKK